jgi:putative ABC transport system substrate-binding protein
MRRRDFIGLFASAAAWPPIARAQQPQMPVIGFLGAAVPDDAEVARNLAAFRKGLAEAGYIEGHNVRFVYRWAEGNYERLPTLAADLVASNVDVIVNEGGAPSVLAAKNATSTIPIVFHTGTDPVADGLIASLSRPGGNLTGVALMQVDLSPKLLQFISELVPKAKAIAVLVNPNNFSAKETVRQLQDAATGTAMRLHVLNASTEAEIDAAFVTLDQVPADALIMGGDTFFTTRRDKLVALVARHSLPAISTQSWFARAGGLVSYGPSLAAAYRLKGNYTGKILSGVKPADLPVQQPTTLELVINLKTAAALRLEVPLFLQQRADEVIE